MAKNEAAVGDVLRITGLATGHKGGDLLVHDSWSGIVQKDIIGTTEALKTIEGREIAGQKGDGAGDIQIEGVFKLNDDSGDLASGELVDFSSPSGVIRAAGGTKVGHVFGAQFTEDSIKKVNVKLLGRPTA